LSPFSNPLASGLNRLTCWQRARESRNGVSVSARGQAAPTLIKQCSDSAMAHLFRLHTARDARWRSFTMMTSGA
jgi:hypothetical protein